MKFDFKRSIEESSSKCGFHCEVFGLSQNHSVALDKQSVSGTKKAGASKGKKTEKPEKSFSEKCQKCPDHTRVCFGCLNQVSTFDTIRDFLVKMEDQWLVHKFELAVKDVIEYKKHIVRAVHQDRAKADLMERLSTEEVLLIFDYAMKFLPQKFREVQTDFFCKER